MAITISSLLNPNPPHQFGLALPLFFLFVVALLVAVLLPFYPQKTWQQAIKRLVTPLWVLGIGGLGLLFVRNQSIQYLSAPIILLAFLLVSFLFFGYSLRVALKEVRAKKVEQQASQRLARYLPKPSQTRPKPKRKS